MVLIVSVCVAALISLACGFAVGVHYERWRNIEVFTQALVEISKEHKLSSEATYQKAISLLTLKMDRIERAKGKTK